MRLLGDTYLRQGKWEMMRHVKRCDIERWIILKWVFTKQDVKMWSGFIWLRIAASHEVS
jgi:hypothetical protein